MLGRERDVEGCGGYQGRLAARTRKDGVGREDPKDQKTWHLVMIVTPSVYSICAISRQGQGWSCKDTVMTERNIGSLKVNHES